MHRIKTAILKKYAEDTNTLSNICILELVESDTGSFHLFRNDLNCPTREFKKTQLFKSFHDLEEVEEYYGAIYSDEIHRGAVSSGDGDNLPFPDLKSLLDFTAGYVDRDGGLADPSEEAPRLMRL
jgi:hypothetical protein